VTGVQTCALPISLNPFKTARRTEIFHPENIIWKKWASRLEIS
jgi:hypothetical protein